MNNGGGFEDHKKSLFGFDFLLALMVLVLCTIGILRCFVLSELSPLSLFYLSIIVGSEI